MQDKRQRLIYTIITEGAVQLTADLKNIQSLLESHQKQAGITGSAIVDAINKQSTAVSGLISQQNALATASNTAAAAQLAATKAATASATAASTAAAAQRATTQAATQAIQQQNAQYGAMKDQLTGLVGLAVSVFAVNAIKNYVEDIIDAKTKVDLFSVSLTTMIGNKKESDEIAGRIFELAKRSPFNVEQLITTTQRLKAMGVETQNLIPYIEALGNMSALVGTARLPLIAKAMVDVQNKGTLMAQEIKQFTDNGVPLFDLLVKSMGKARQAIVDLAYDHKISFADVEKAILQASEKGGIYYNAMTNQAKTLGGQVSNLSDLFFLGKDKIGDYFENGLQKGITIMGDFLKATIGSNSAIARTVTTLEGALALWLSYKVAVIATNASLAANQQATLTSMGTQLTANTVTAVGTGLTTSLSTAFKGLWLAMSANPIGFVISALGLAFSAFQLYEASVMKVTAAESEELNMLNKTKAGFEANIKALINLTVGSEERNAQVAKLQAQYPGYIRNIDLESASQSELFGLLKKVNSEIERKIKLAIQDSYTQSIQEKAIELGREQLKIYTSLRENNKAYINDSNLSNEEFLDKLKDVQLRMGDRTGLNTMNRLGIETLANTQKEMDKLTGQMAQSINQTTLITKNNLKENQKDLLEDLAFQQKSLNEKHSKAQELAKGNTTKLAQIDAEYKKDWNDGIDQYRIDYKGLMGDKVKENKISTAQIESIEEKYGERTATRRKKEREEQYKSDVQAVQDKYKNDVDGEKKITDAIIVLYHDYEKDLKNIDESGRKAKKENHTLSAKEITLIKLKEVTDSLDLSKQLSKDEIKLLKDLAKAELDVSIERVNKKFKTVKDGETKIALEVQKLTVEYMAKIEKIEFDANRKRFAGIELIENKHLTTKELTQKANLDKEQKAQEKQNAKLDDLTKDFLESQQKLQDAQRLQDELKNAKTATEKYNVMVKYGKRTADELLAMSVSRWKVEQAQLVVQLKFAEVIYGKDSVQYKYYQEQNLILSTKINNAMTTVITKQADETLRTYGRVYTFYIKHMEGVFKVFDKTFSDIQAVYQASMDFQMKSLEDTYNKQYAFLGNDYAARLILTEEFAVKQNELLIDQARQNKIFTMLSAITKGVSDAFEKQKSLNEQYQNKTITEYQKTAGTVANIVGVTAGIISQVLTTSYNDELKLIDAKGKNNERYYEDTVKLAQQGLDAKIKLIDQEEKAHSTAIDRELAIELRKIDILQRLSVNANDAEAKKALDDLTKGKTNELGVLTKAKDEELNGAKLKYDNLKSMALGANAFIEQDRQVALHKLFVDRQAEIADAEAKGLDTFAIEEKYRNLTNATNADFAKKQSDNLILRQDLQKNAKDIFEAEKADIELRYENKKNEILDNAEKAKQDILNKSEKKKGDIIATAEIAKTMAISQNEEKRGKIIQDALDAKLKAQYEYDTLEYEAKKNLIVQQGELELKRLEQERNIKKAQISMSIAVGIAQLFAINPIAGFVGLAVGLAAGAALFAGIDNYTGAAAHEVNQRIQDSKNATPPVAPTKSKPIVYIRTTAQNAQAGGIAQFEAAGGQLFSNPNGMVDFNQNPQGANNHEAPIDYINWQGAKFGVYGWDDFESNGVIYKVPDLFRKYFDGTNYIERGQHKQGRDTIPAMVNEGERILTTEQNTQLGGRNKPNEQIVKEVQFAEFVMRKMPNLMDMFKETGGMPRLRMDDKRERFDDEKMVKAVQSLEETLKNKKTSNVNINVDKHKVDIQEHQENSRINYHNAIYKRNHNN